MKLKLVFPSIEYKHLIEDYKSSFMLRSDIIHGSGGLDRYESIDEWLDYIVQNQSEKTVGGNLVPSSTYLVFDEDIDQEHIVGMVDIRHRLNDHLLAYGGHIGYSVAYDMRNLGYGKRILQLALQQCSILNIESVLVSCMTNNIPSSKIIESAGGTLENVVEFNGELQSRYWINNVVSTR